MQTYIGIKMIEAAPADKDGEPGYNVIYPDGYASWSPKEAFEKAYLPIKEANTLNQDDIDQLMTTPQASTVDPKTTLVGIELITGFSLYDTSSCVNPENYNQQKGAFMAIDKINQKLWFAMGFVLQWARYGLKNTPTQELKKDQEAT